MARRERSTKQEERSSRSIDRSKVKDRHRQREDPEYEDLELEPLDELEEEEFDYEDDLDIDKFRLDVECATHPRKYMRYAKAAAKANKRARQAEERVKTIRSEIVNRSKETPAGKNAATLEAAYRTNPVYIRAKKEWIEAQFEADLLTNAMFAMQAKKSMIESMVKLHGQEYFSTPTIDSESAEKFNELKRSGARSKIRERMKR